MFVVCFGDGLGNQMFQYAFYKALQISYSNNNVKMDIFHIYGQNIHNGFELDKIFPIVRNECTKSQALALAEYYPAGMKMQKLMNYLIRRKERIWGMKPSYIHVDDPTAYYEEVFHLNRLNSYLFCGNWFNERYFSSIRKELLKDFEFIQPLDDANSKLVEEMQERQSVALHIRRGDYLNYPNLSWITDNYYKRAIDYILEHVENPFFYIFSDDKEYVKERFGVLENMYVVDNNTGEYSYRDMQLMSMCKHNIIANSSFSFWGAWLNTHVSKIVVAPSKTSKTLRNPIACSDWILIDGE